MKPHGVGLFFFFIFSPLLINDRKWIILPTTTTPTERLLVSHYYFYWRENDKRKCSSSSSVRLFRLSASHMHMMKNHRFLLVEESKMFGNEFSLFLFGYFPIEIGRKKLIYYSSMDGNKKTRKAEVISQCETSRCQKIFSPSLYLLVFFLYNKMRVKERNRNIKYISIIYLNWNSTPLHING